MEWLILLLGLPVSVAAARVDVLLMWWINRFRHGKLRMSGNWIEWVPKSEGRQFSIGCIEYNLLRRRYNFDGTNYKNSGEPFCHWRTVTSYVDYEQLEFHYVFATKDVDTLQTSSYGYGVVQLVRRNGELVPEYGYYIYATGNDNAISVSHSMRRLDSLPESRNDNAFSILTAAYPEKAQEIAQSSKDTESEIGHSQKESTE